MNLPKDDFLLLSVVNTALRDNFSSLEELCEEEDISKDEITSRLLKIGYSYDKATNSFK